MKNIHVLPTPKPSRLHYSKVKTDEKISYKLILKQESLTCNDGLLSGQKNIYITSDEEIKEGDWMIRGNEQPIKVTKDFFWDFGVRYYKIILTTDQDLDGVQSIDDEFLEWFVKNPSCEQVVVNLIQTEPLKGFIYNFEYKIIIPKEEQKPIHQQIIDAIGGEDRFKEIAKIKPKQETLEEVAERILGNNIDGLRDALKDDDLFFFYKGVIQSYGEAMAQYQAKRMYGEENVFQFFEKYREDFSIHRNIQVLDSQFKEWFEQFKKK